jgi:hypothetical protein
MAWGSDMTPSLKDNEFTITIPFNDWVEQTIDRAVDRAVDLSVRRAVSKAVSDCPHTSTVEKMDKFIELWTRRWYLFAGGLLVVSFLGGLVGGSDRLVRLILGA